MPLLNKSITIKEIVWFVIKIIMLLLFEVYIFIFMLNPLTTRHYMTAGYKYATYDVMLRNATHSYIQTLIAEGKVERALEISSGIHYYSGNNYNIEIYSLNGNSLDEVYDILIPEKMFIELDKELMRKENAVIIHSGHASDLGISCGDIINIGRLVSGNVETYSVQVAGLFESSISNNFGIDAIALNKIKGDTSFLSQFVYVEFKDSNTGIQYIKDNYYSQENVFIKYGDEWAEKITESEKKEERERIGNYSIRNISLRTAEADLGYNKIETYVHVSIGLFFIIIVQIYNNHKSIKLNLKKLAILRVCGMPMYKIFINRFIMSFGTQTVIMLIIAVISGYTRFILRHIPKAILMQGIPVIVFCSLISSLLIGIFVLLELRKQNISIILKSEA